MCIYNYTYLNTNNVLIQFRNPLVGITGPPPSSEEISVTVLSSEDVQVTCPQPLNCLVLIQSLTSLNTLLVRFIESFITSTIFSVDTVSNDSYVVVYSWDSEQSIFNGKVSLITSLDSPTSKYVFILCTNSLKASHHHTVVPTSVSPTNPSPSTVSQALSLPIEAIAGTRIMMIILIWNVFVCIQEYQWG